MHGGAGAVVTVADGCDLPERVSTGELITVITSTITAAITCAITAITSAIDTAQLRRRRSIDLAAGRRRRSIDLAAAAAPVHAGTIGACTNDRRTNERGRKEETKCFGLGGNGGSSKRKS